MYKIIDSLCTTYGLFNTIEQVVHFLYKHQEIMYFTVYNLDGLDVTWIVKDKYREKYH